MSLASSRDLILLRSFRRSFVAASAASSASSAPSAPPALLEPGSAPIVTEAYHLPARAVCHVTGPQIVDPARFRVGPPTATERAQLEDVYRGVLEACRRRGFRSVAFCCVSTGLFGYPARDAAATALATVRDWLLRAAAQEGELEEEEEEEGHNGNGNGKYNPLELVVFDVFTDEDEACYTELAPTIITPV